MNEQVFKSEVVINHVDPMVFLGGKEQIRIQQQQQQSFILCPEKFTVDKYMQRDKLTMKKMSTAT